MTDGPLRLLLADDQAMVRAGFRMILDAEPDIAVVGEAGDGLGAVEQTRLLHPDIVLMDIQMPVMDGIAATAEIVAGTDTKVIVLTTFERDDYIVEALRAGASGFLLKNAPPDDLVEAIHVVAGGDALLAPSVTRRLVSQLASQTLVAPPPAAELEALTEREAEVLTLVARGLSNAEIAEALVVGEATVKTHVSRILTKLDLRDRVQAVIYAYEHGLVRPGAA